MEPRRQQACLTSCVLTDAAIRTTYSVAGPLVRNIRDSVPLTQYGTSVDLHDRRVQLETAAAC